MKQNCLVAIINLKTLVLHGNKMSQRTTGFLFSWLSSLPNEVFNED